MPTDDDFIEIGDSGLVPKGKGFVFSNTKEDVPLPEEEEDDETPPEDYK